MQLKPIIEVMKEQQLTPPALGKTADGAIETNSLADLLEWFLMNDAKVTIVRQQHVEEVFQWKQLDDTQQGIPTYPFENAEARFAIGVFQAIQENNTEETLNYWISDILNALQDAKKTNSSIAESYKLTQHGVSSIDESNKIPSAMERRVYLSCCWIEALCIAEARFLGWVYQEHYGKPFAPMA
jgi:hypothetical protein